MSQTQPPQLRLQTYGDVAQLVPYLLGFEPEESLVLAVFGGNRLELAARIDLAEVQPPAEAENLVDRVWRRFPGANAYLIAYTSDHQAGWTLLRRLRSYLPAAAVRQALLIDRDTWYTSNGDQGTVDRFGHLAAQATGYGLQRRPSRAELTDSLTSPPNTERLNDQVTAALRDLPDSEDTAALRARFTQLMRVNLPGSQTPEQRTPMTTADAVQLAALVHDPDVRDVALLAITLDNAPQHLALWRNVVTRVPADGAATPFYILGMSAWASSEGSLAAIALDRCWECSPAGPPGPAALLHRVIQEVAPPSAWIGLRADVLSTATQETRAAVNELDATSPTWEAVPPPRRPNRPPTGHAPSDTGIPI